MKQTLHEKIENIIKRIEGNIYRLEINMSEYIDSQSYSEAALCKSKIHALNLVLSDLKNAIK